MCPAIITAGRDLRQKADSLVLLRLWMTGVLLKLYAMEDSSQQLLRWILYIENLIIISRIPYIGEAYIMDLAVPTPAFMCPRDQISRTGLIFLR